MRNNLYSQVVRCVNLVVIGKAKMFLSKLINIMLQSETNIANDGCAWCGTNPRDGKKENVRHVMFARGLPAYYFITPGQASLRNFGKIRCRSDSMAEPKKAAFLCPPALDPDPIPPLHTSCTHITYIIRI